MRKLTLASVILTLVCSTLSISPARAVEPLAFKPAPDFFKLPDSITLGAGSGVAVNSHGDIYLFHRGKQPIIQVKRNGTFVRAWGDGVIDTAHGLRIDDADNVWVTDIGNHQVLKFSAEGKLLLTLGKAGQAGLGTDEFDKPTDVAFGARGEIYVSDGYGNSRVMKFTPNGGYLTSWGEPGDGPSQFDTPHTIVVDRRGRVVVGDRENDRVQVFDGNGKLIETWGDFAPFGLAYDKQGTLFVADGRAHKILQLDSKGRVVASFGQEGAGPGQFQLPHMLAADGDGNLYVGEIQSQRFQKLTRQ